MVMDRLKYPYGTEGVYYSQLVVCHDREGYFIGRRKYNEELQREEAGTRESEETYTTQAAAAKALKDGTFTAMIDDTLNDGERVGVDIGWDSDDIRGVVAAHADTLHWFGAAPLRPDPADEKKPWPARAA